MCPDADIIHIGKHTFLFQILGDFVMEFFDQNPISQVCMRHYVCIVVSLHLYFLQLGVIATKNGKAEKLLDLNGTCVYTDCMLL